uniref:Uncharacterized protein n=1 Tax=Arundo donax TaxID=35708 RepID=A0A0A9AE99_ARUDO
MCLPEFVHSHVHTRGKQRSHIPKCFPSTHSSSPASLLHTSFVQWGSGAIDLLG